MAEHCTKSQIARFSVSALPAQELDRIAEHLADCAACQEVLVATLKRQRGTDSVKFSLDPKFLFRHDHLDYEQLVNIVENKIDETEREIIDIHLSSCATCREDLRSFQDFRNQLEPELAVRYGPLATTPRNDGNARTDRRFGLRWNPVYTAVAVLVTIGLITAVIFITQRSRILEALRTQPSPNTPTTSPTPNRGTEVVTNSSPTPVPTEQPPFHQPSPALTVKNRSTMTAFDRATVAEVRDQGRAITIDKNGDVLGIQDIPNDTRQAIAEALVAQTLKTPPINEELAGSPITLRGPDNTPTFRLLSPGREVLLSDRPSFAWEKLAGASSYRVIIGDLTGHEIAKSEELSADQTTWTPTKPLKRGEIYTWEVEAILDGKKVHAPGTSQTQMKFVVLSERGAQELEQLKRVNSHLALGVFYAREGMLTEAEHEFQILVRDNPNSPVLRNLLKQIQSWRHDGH